MPKFIDLTGMKFGRLTVIERAENSKDGKTRWCCECDCGTSLIVQGNHLREGATTSCGCLAIENQTTHGLSNTRIYRTWVAIKQRCLNPNSSEYHNYGGRGIKICDEWLNFQNFFDYVSQLPHYGEENTSLDRIDVNGNYEPNNVRWGDRKTQARNTRRNVFVDYYGVKMLIPDVAKLTGISENTLRSRARLGLTGEQLFRPVKMFVPKNKKVKSPKSEPVKEDSAPIEENLNVPSTQIFSNEKFGEIRGAMIDDVPYFVGKDVAAALGYTNPQKAIRDHVEEDDKRTERIVHPLGGVQATILINESGLYSLILGSKLPKAKEFKHWVTSEVLPTIRKTGKYEVNDAPKEKLSLEQKIETLKFLVEHSPNDEVKISYLEKIAALI